MQKNIGRVVQIQGPVIDVKFDDNHMPELLTAIKVALGNDKYLTIEVAQHIGDDIVRCISMGPTEGLIRGMEAIDTGLYAGLDSQVSRYEARYFFL